MGLRCVYCCASDISRYRRVRSFQWWKAENGQCESFQSRFEISLHMKFLFLGILASRSEHAGFARRFQLDGEFYQFNHAAWGVE